MTPEEQRLAKDAIFEFLQETNGIFSMIKKYAVLIEEIYPKNKAPIHSANELKSLVFHLYNSATTPKGLESNILEAKEHLCRAFHDLHYIVVSSYIELIKQKIKPFKRTTVADAFPEYNNTIKPTIRDIQEAIREVRANRNTDLDLLNSGISGFELQVKTLAKFDDIVDSEITEMNKFDREKRKEKYSKGLWDVLKILLGAIIGAAITFFVTKSNSNTPTTEKSKPESHSNYTNDTTK